MNELPTVSVVTPSYNQGRFIERTIQSVQRQDYPRVEHIVMDGGSDDETLAILRRYENRIRWFSGPDTGTANAINKGFEAARGDIFAWLSSDDVYFYRDTVGRVVQAFLERRDAGLVTGGTVLLDEQDLIMQVFRIPARFNYQRLLRYDYIRQPATFFRRSVWERHRLDEALGCAFDYEYWLRVTRDFSVVHLRDLLAGIRRHAQTKTVRLSRRMDEEAHAVQLRNGYRPYALTGAVSDALLRAALKCAGIADITALYARRPGAALATDARYDHVLLAYLRQLLNRKGFGIRGGAAPRNADLAAASGTHGAV